MGGQFGFAIHQVTFKPKPLPENFRLDGQTAIVTGSNIGIGLETARRLAAHGVARIILGVRNVSKGKAAKDDITRTHPECSLAVWELDMERADSITAFADRASTLDRLDMVILNAATKQLKWTTTSSGHEKNLQVNHIGPALLSLLLMPTLKSTAKQSGKPGRLTFTSSEAHFWTPFRERMAPNVLARMDQKEFFHDGLERYRTTKLLNVLWFRELALKVDPKEIIINGVNPGYVKTQLHQHDPSTGHRIVKKVLAWTPEKSSHIVVDAVAAQNAESHGAYIQEQKITAPSKFVLSTEGENVQEKLWAETIELIYRDSPKLASDCSLFMIVGRLPRAEIDEDGNSCDGYIDKAPQVADITPGLMPDVEKSPVHGIPHTPRTPRTPANLAPISPVKNGIEAPVGSPFEPPADNTFGIAM